MMFLISLGLVHLWSLEGNSLLGSWRLASVHHLQVYIGEDRPLPLLLHSWRRWEAILPEHHRLSLSVEHHTGPCCSLLNDGDSVLWKFGSTSTWCDSSHLHISNQTSHLSISALFSVPTPHLSLWVHLLDVLVWSCPDSRMSLRDGLTICQVMDYWLLVFAALFY